MLTEYVSGGTLTDYIKEKGGNLSEEEAKSIMFKVI